MSFVFVLDLPGARTCERGTNELSVLGDNLAVVSLLRGLVVMRLQMGGIGDGLSGVVQPLGLGHGRQMNNKRLDTTLNGIQ